jgi:hypothetical protein
MPVTFAIESESGIIRTRCTGIVTLEDVLAHFRELRETPELPKRLDVLLDMSEMESFPKTDELKSVVNAIGGLEDRLEWGLLAMVASQDVLYGMSRMLEVFVEDHFEKSSVCRELGEAESWLARMRSPAD